MKGQTLVHSSSKDTRGIVDGLGFAWPWWPCYSGLFGNRAPTWSDIFHVWENDKLSMATGAVVLCSAQNLWSSPFTGVLTMKPVNRTLQLTMNHPSFGNYLLILEVNASQHTAKEFYIPELYPKFIVLITFTHKITVSRDQSRGLTVPSRCRRPAISHRHHRGTTGSWITTFCSRWWLLQICIIYIYKYIYIYNTLIH